ncbi:tRNA (guanine(10)-N(2))-dimethyltransferase [Archaeoglobus fulgidus]|uniref:tRNA (guanine(26)-N(2))-dimethyltransferase n=1 Tax=Archaeoglobus fulgidus (strain ATCC 49558 / DSM 4304 / JCM 9628 / NBRC 100126 / VC-16) TaxID=224325 RepID=TRM1_ARCFU|nr:tRNA (guanine(10)-N(2))-dimethyltransferase [Archaeoglobus fulgidus]O29443.1 RecName: Full=tRNA (guanine(26)-N(2))-dimethyltransferase; AltName: Full=tRNA 2,2-dimethylguanosine-26 methyltransferase; AltName: Full=tRNA(guanine-26,N(2)-N(2)) methyltransferase; AltName: Full=tRNA(m(2,2)G26)dimethyltransferase [Archaeoglobus fulgidus DSM 4304]AAB90427.1 N2,N2-dimethylguanosine tRNA methyltransferase (trm1) [Archaeoglobus fulgidus DSM 4304]
MEVEEGRARVKVEGVFYNPRMRFCRDLDMLVFATMDSKEYFDALSASGIRGIRAALEAGKKAVFNDVSPKAVKVIEENLRENGVSGEVINGDAAAVMRQRAFEHIDIDPFGSPAPFMDSACFSAKRYLSVTATDTAALCGSATNSGLKKYGAFAVKTDVYHEVGLRMLIGFVVREATKYEKALFPLISWVREHYYRVHFKIKKSTAMSAKVYEKMGYLAYCSTCLRKKVLGMGEGAERCECGGKFSLIGPIWLGELKQRDFAEKVAEKAEGKLRAFLEKILAEIDAPTAYSLPALAKIHSLTLPPTDVVVEELKKLGYEASRTHYCGFCVKTDADRDVVVKILRSRKII